MPSISLPAVFGGTAAAAGTAGAAAGTTAVIGTGIAGASTLAAATVPAIAGISTASVPLAAATPWLADIGLGTSLLGGVTGAVGAYTQGKAAAASAKYNAAVASDNALQAKSNSVLAAQSGEAQAGIQEQKTRANVGSILANQGASNIDVNSGSNVDVRSSASELGELNALTVKSNAAREAYGYQVQGVGFQNQGALDKAEASNDTSAGTINAASTFLGGAGSAAGNYAKYQLSSGFGF